MPDSSSPKPHYSFLRYLTAKTTVDDRALNPHVWETMARVAQPEKPGQPLRILEIGCGIGTMLARLQARGLGETPLQYTGIDADEESITHARERYSAAAGAPDRSIPAPVFRHADLFSLPPDIPERSFDLLLAHAFLDIVDVSLALPILFRYLRSGGVFTFTLNFDGETIFQPEHPLDSAIISLYHQTMDERVTDGRPSGDSQSGRHLFGHLRRAGAEILGAGSSDWVVFPTPGGYPGDEAYFLHHILHFFEESLAAHPGLEEQALANWLAARRAQIEHGELVFIAHQLDFVGKV